MIRAGSNNPINPIIILGLSEENVSRLKNNQPLELSIQSFGVDLPGKILILYGPTEKDIEMDFRKAGLIAESTEFQSDAQLEKEIQIRNKAEKILICTVGLPQSGKSTWAQRQTWPIVNPDSIRLAIHGQRYIAEVEPFVWETAKTMVKALFLAGHKTVILDATNNTRKRRDQWQSSDWATYFKVIDTPAQTCIERALANHDTEIVPVIERMAAQYEPLIESEMLWP